MASAALPPTHPPPPPSHNTPPESPLGRMNHHHQFFNNIRGSQPPSGSGGSCSTPPMMTSSSTGGSSSSNNNNNNNELDSYGTYNPGSDPYYQEASATSGSNSCDEEELPPGSKRSLNGGISSLPFNSSSKKRRKQSNPLRLGLELSSNEDNQRDREAEEDTRRYSTEEEEGEDRSRITCRPSSSGDSPLNLSSGSSSNNNNNSSQREPGEKVPSLRVLGPELMSSPEFESGELISKLSGLPPNCSAAATATSLYQAAAAGMLPFGLGGPFPFPFPPKSGLGSPGGAGVPRSSQIFNPEAYCELCNKEFCNKYFLKTHKANKHGIYTDPLPNSSSGQSPSASEITNSSTSSVMANNSTQHHHNSTSSSSNINSTNNNSSSNTKSLQFSHHPPPPPSHHHPHSSHPHSSSSQQSTGSPFSGAFIAANMSGALRPPFMPLSPPSHSSPSPAGKMVDEGRGGPSSPGVRSNTSSSAANDNNGELRRSLESPLGRLPPSVGGGTGNGGSNGGSLNPLLFGGASKDHSDRIPAKSSFSQDKLRQMGVINADAFCEICCKEFCNKYFLRVHKLKKHGICSPDLPPEKVQKILSQMAKEAGKTGQPPPQLVRPNLPSSGGGGSSPSSSSSPNNTTTNNSMIPPPSPKSPRPRSSNTPSLPTETLKEKDVIHLDDSSSSYGLIKKCETEEEEEGELIKKSSSEDLQRLQSMIMELNSGKEMRRSEDDGSSICKICSKDMENKFFLRAHLMNEHGIGLNHEEHPPFKDSSLLHANPFLHNGFLESSKSSLDFTNKFLQQMTKGFSQSEEERAYLERVKNELAASGGLSPRKLLESKDPNRRPASLSRSYCEICKKELCNKYFMKTHMMKMHGINIDGGSPGGPGLGSVGGGVSCHICKKELCSKYFLKVHLQNSHGLNEDGLPVGSGQHSIHQGSSAIKENGSASSLFPSLFPPPPPEFPDKESTPQYFSRLLGEQSEKLKQQQFAAAQHDEKANKDSPGDESDNPFVCPFCGEDMKELVLLQVHIIRTHGSFPQPSSENNNRGGNVNASPPRSLFHGSSNNNNSNTHPRDEEDYDVKDVRLPSRGALGDEDDEEERKSMSKLYSRDEADDEEEGARRKSPKTPPTNPSSQHLNNNNENHHLLHPHKPSPSSSLSSNNDKGLITGTSPPDFPNIEMIQRHMLSTQFSGLINPLLSAGFPALAGGSLSFPIQKLLSSNSSNHLSRASSPPQPNARPSNSTPPNPSSSQVAKDSSSSSLTSRGTRRRRYKCPKCNSKFKKRELCLSHLSESHGVSIRRKLRFSPLKNSVAKKNHHRSEYVRHFMELLRFPTSRATPRSKSSEAHIMQPFLLKAPGSPSGDEENSAEGQDLKNSAGFVPSLIYLPVAKRVSGPMRVAFNLIPA
ncbi:uncharacterized protein [Lepeophtheirus salmonis]|uniref:uncharacterized protein n=1 Tax=Lepeophtheirus salmonis TaxID=72036 RepID=UPI001AE8FA1B|nr:uncharacterized protein LOC121116361 [Lepeophtheirus salmonis]